MYDLTIEQAFYFEIMLSGGLSQSFDKWLIEALTYSKAIDGVLLELSCAADKNDVISILHNYTCCESPNKDTVLESVLAELKNRYIKNEISIMKCLDIMKIASDKFKIYSYEPWLSLYTMRSFYDDAINNIIDMDSFIEAFEMFLFKRIPITRKN